MRIALTLFLLTLALVLADEPPFEGAPFKLGAISSLSGPAAEQGKNWLEGSQLAVEDLNAQGIKVSLVVEDDATIPARTNAAFMKLAARDKVRGLIGGTWDFLAEAAAPLSARFKLPLVTPTNPIEIVSESAKANPYFLVHSLSLRATGRAIHDFLSEQKVKSIAIVVPNVPFGISHADVVERIAKQLGIAVSSRLQYDYGGYHDTLRTFASTVANTRPDLIFCAADYAAMNTFVVELQRLSYDPWLLTTQHLDGAVRLSKNPSIWKKAYGVYPKIKDTKFAQRFELRFGHEPRVYAAEGYDAALFLGSALARGIDLSTTPYSIQGISGMLSYTPPNRTISDIEAQVFGVDEHGNLQEWQAAGQKVAVGQRDLFW